MKSQTKPRPDQHPSSRPAKSKKYVKQTAHLETRLDGKPLIFGWGSHLSRTEKIQIQRRAVWSLTTVIIAAIIAAFGRVISEVGISMMLGGNIKGFTRTMTTAMALEYDKGAFILSIALGIVLLGISFGMNMLFHFFQGRSRA